MKRIICLLLSFISFDGFSQNAHCNCTIMSLSAGAPYNVYAEAGTMNIKRFGVYGGVAFFTQQQKQIITNKNINSDNTDILFAPYIKASYRLSNNEESNWRHYVLAFYGLHKYTGISYRLGYIVGENTMISFEPTYMFSQKSMLNFTLVNRLN